MSKRYTLEFAVKECDEDGETFGPELHGATISYASEDEDLIRALMEVVVGKADGAMERLDVPSRRPIEEEEEDDDDVLADDELPSDMYDVWKNMRIDSQRGR